MSIALTSAAELAGVVTQLNMVTDHLKALITPDLAEPVKVSPSEVLVKDLVIGSSGGRSLVTGVVRVDDESGTITITTEHGELTCHAYDTVRVIREA